MKQYNCECGHRIFFDSTVCVGCGRPLGFDPQRLAMVSLNRQPDGSLADRNGNVFQYCRNFEEYEACAWLVPDGGQARYCLGCNRTEIIPNLEVPGNHVLWIRLEAAKRRLLYSLLSLRLPMAAEDGTRQLRFRFLEDRSRNPAVLENFVGTGHAAGTITINVAEADDAARHAIREQMQERYRTLLGHFRHEIGHYYFEILVRDGQYLEEFRRLFGDERADYPTAMEIYYRDGPPDDWPARHVSAYAAAHPHEDWAESFAHYLHISDAFETAESAGLIAKNAGDASAWLPEWMELSVTLNELARSLGVDDPYPFILPRGVIEKLRFIDRLVRPTAAHAAAAPV